MNKHSEPHDKRERKIKPNSVGALNSLIYLPQEGMEEHSSSNGVRSASQYG